MRNKPVFAGFFARDAPTKTVAKPSETVLPAFCGLALHIAHGCIDGSEAAVDPANRGR